MSKVSNKRIPYQIQMNLVDYVEFQIRLIFGKEISKFSKGEVQVLSHLYLDRKLDSVTDKIIESNIRTSRKSVYNDVMKFKKESILDLEENAIKFNPDIIIVTEPSIFEIRVEL